MARDALGANGYRSAAFFGAEGRRSFVRNAHQRAGVGFPDGVLRSGRPVIGICNSYSELNPCNAHLGRVADAVKRGVWEAGGVPLEFPVISLGETNMRPTTMLFRNLMSMDVEECIRANPIDGVVLLGGCDKTTPALLMGAASVDLPTVLVTGGPMLTGKWRGRDLGSGTDARRFSDEVRGGRMTEEEMYDAEGCYARSTGHCMTMGTASTMACIGEALGLQLPGTAAIPAPDARREQAAQLAGRRIVGLVAEGLRMSAMLTRASFENAIRTNAALSGSTNAVVHLLALAGRAGVPLTLDDFDRWMRDVPWLADMMPSGRHLMEDFYYAGGLPAVMAEIAELLHLDAPTVSGGTVGANLAAAECHNREVIRPLSDALGTGAGTAVLRGNLCPDGAVIKQSAADPRLLRHRGRALVFDSIRECEQDIDRPDLDIDENSVLVVRGCGPRGFPGMPEVGNLPIPRKLLERGITDMVRISDARMSGTAYGTVVLHVAPEGAVGGPLALARTGDLVSLDVPGRTLDVEVPAEELQRRRAEWSPPPRRFERGYARLYVEHVLQADRGVDFDFLVGASGPEPHGGELGEPAGRLGAGRPGG